MTYSASMGKLLSFSSIESIEEANILQKGEIYIFKKQMSNGIVFNGGIMGIENVKNRLLDTNEIVATMKNKLAEQYGEELTVLYMHVSFDDIIPMGTDVRVTNYELILHVKDNGSISAAVVIAIAVATVIIGSFIVAVWLIWHALGVLPPGLDIGFIVAVLIALFVLAVLFLSGGKSRIKTKRGSVSTG